jgi:branched-chain amino acid transport system permease protein
MSVEGLETAGAPVPAAQQTPTPGSQPWFTRVRLPRQPLVRHLLLGVLGFGALVLLTFNVNATANNELSVSACYVAVIAGLSVLTGISGQISLGNGAFMAVGAYTTGIWMNHYPSQPFIIALLAGTIAGALFGIVIGMPATRLSGPYLAGMTLAFAVALPQIVAYQGWTSVLGGESGLELSNQPQPPQWLLNHSQTPGLSAFGIASSRYYAWIGIAGAVVTLILLANLLSSRFGRQFRAVRDDDVAAELMGIHVARTRVIAFATSAACAGLGGGLFIVIQGAVDPTTFLVSLSITLVAAMVIGGIGTLMGAVWGGVILGFSNTWITDLSNALGINPTSNVGANLQAAIFGSLLIILILAAPGGIQRLISYSYLKAAGRFTARRAREKDISALT